MLRILAFPTCGLCGKDFDPKDNPQFIAEDPICASCEKSSLEEQDAFMLRLDEIRRMPYSEYLQSDEWKKTRRLVLQNARNRCQICASRSHLNVHHRRYTILGLEMFSDLTVLCQNCHAKFHDKLPRWVQ